MRLAQISHFLFHLPKSKTSESKERFQTALAGHIGVLFGLLMGMTAMSILLDQEIAGRPGILLPRILILLTFGLLSMILFTKGSDSEEE